MNQKQSNEIEKILNTAAIIEERVTDEDINIKEFEHYYEKKLDERIRVNKIEHISLVNIFQPKVKFHNVNLGPNNVRLKRTQDRNKDDGKNDPESFISLNDGSSSISKIKYDKKNTNISNASSSVEMIYRNRKQTQKGLLTAAEEKKYGKLVQQLLKIQAAEQHLHVNKN